MRNGFYYIVSNSGRIIWVYTSCGSALMDLTAMWAGGSCGLNIVYNGAVLYRLGNNGIEKVGA
jgi:hypothetical protein